MSKWQGLDMNLVYAEWADALQNSTLSAINHGIHQAKLSAHPPNLGEFLIYCKTYKHDQPVQRLVKLHPKDREQGLARIAAIRETLARKMTNDR